MEVSIKDGIKMMTTASSAGSKPLQCVGHGPGYGHDREIRRPGVDRLGPPTDGDGGATIAAPPRRINI